MPRALERLDDAISPALAQYRGEQTIALAVVLDFVLLEITFAPRGNADALVAPTEHLGNQDRASETVAVSSPQFCSGSGERIARRAARQITGTIQAGGVELFHINEFDWRLGIRDLP